MYEDFASVYDRLMEIDYDRMADGYEQIFKEFQASPQMILDLACGSGEVTLRMADRGYEMIGVDASAEMLSKAREKTMEKGADILYLCQDMRSFELYGTVDAVISTLDAVNYLPDEESVAECFHWVNNYLLDGGLFIFDVNTPYKLREVLGNNTFVAEEDGIFYTWENEYDEKTDTTAFLLNIFCMDADGRYTRMVEEQTEKVYTLGTLRRLIEKSGMTLEKVYGEDMRSEPGAQSERMFLVARAHNHNKEEKT